MIQCLPQSWNGFETFFSGHSNVTIPEIYKKHFIEMHFLEYLRLLGGRGERLVQKQDCFSVRNINLYFEFLWENNPFFSISECLELFTKAQPFSSVCIYQSTSSLQLFRKCNRNLKIRGELSPHLEQINECLRQPCKSKYVTEEFAQLYDTAT